MSGQDKQKADNLLHGRDSEKAKAADPSVDQADIEKRVAAIRAATKKDDAVDTGTDEEAINKQLEGTTQAQRDAMNALYKEKYGVSLTKELKDEMSGDDLDKALKPLGKPDVEKADKPIDTS